MPRIFASSALLLLAALALSTTGCAADTDAADEGSDDLTARAGYKKLRSDDNVYTGIAVSGDTAYLAANNWTIDVVSLKTMKKTKTFTKTTASALAFDDGKLVSCGMRDDGPLVWYPHPSDGMANNYVVSFLDPATGTLQKEVILKMEAYLVSANREGDPFIDLPNTSCKVSGGMITIGFAQKKLQHELVSFKVPTATKSVFEFQEIPGATRIKVGLPKREGTISGFAQSRENGITLASGGWGIDRLTTGPVKQLRKSGPREWFTDIWDGGTTMWATELDGLLVSLNPKTGETLTSTEVPDMLEAVTVDSGYVFAAARKGLFIKKLPAR